MNVEPWAQAAHARIACSGVGSVFLSAFDGYCKGIGFFWEMEAITPWRIESAGYINAIILMSIRWSDVTLAGGRRPKGASKTACDRVEWTHGIQTVALEQEETGMSLRLASKAILARRVSCRSRFLRICVGIPTGLQNDQSWARVSGVSPVLKNFCALQGESRVKDAWSSYAPEIASSRHFSMAWQGAVVGATLDRARCCCEADDSQFTASIE